MSVSRPAHLFHRMIASVSIIGMMSSSLLAQTGQPAQAPEAPKAQTDYTAPLSQSTQPASILSGWKPYAPHSLPQPVLKNSDRLHSLIKDGRLMLSLNDAVALTLENNFDIAIARYNLDIADMDLLRTKSGGSVRGVSTGLLSGTPGGNAASTSTTTGSTGSGSGGTTTGTGGSASGSGGLVSSTQSSVGSAIDSYDPVLSATLSADRNKLQVNPMAYGLSSYNLNTNTYNFNYSQGWETGTLAQVSYSNTRTINDLGNGITDPILLASINEYTPTITGVWKATVRQHLLQGWGIDNNRREMIIAKNNRKVTDASFRAQVISTVAQIQNIYWDLVNAYEDLKVQQTAVQFAQRTLSDNKKQVEIGTLAPIEVVSAESSVAAAQQKLITSQTNLQYQQLITKNAIARNFNDPELTAAEVVPTDTMALSNDPVPPAEELVNYALAHRPELLESELTLRNNEINNKAAKNALLPTLDLVAYYGATGTSNSYGDSFTAMANRNYPNRGAYFNLEIPLRNRQAQADQIRSELEYRQTQLNFQQQKNQINLQVRNAAFTLQQSRAGVESARAARDYAQQSLDAEQKKYALGASTSYLVLQQQSSSTQAASNYVAALSTYEKARVSLDQLTATILERNGISMEDAASGQVSHPPSVPGLQPNTTPSTVTAQPVAK